MEEETLTIELPSECVEFYNEDEEAFIESLHQTLIDHYKKIEFYLPRYCNNYREEFSDDSASIEECDITLTEGNQGHLYISFDGYISAGCRDADTSMDHSQRIDFELTDDGSSITLFFHYLPERNPDEY